jgi:hypothetical protein
MRQNAVTINVGADNGVQRGMDFVVYRNKEFIATIVIDKVEKGSSTGGLFVSEGSNTVRAGDKVASRVY